MPEPTMADIAARLGVSRQLVSLVLREQPGASPETRARVLRAAAELGYRPHVGAQSLRQSRSRHLGVVFAPAHATEPDIVAAVYPAAAAHGYHVVLSAQTASRTVQDAVDELIGYRCAAVVVIGSELDHVAMRELAQRAGVPLVAVGAGARNTVYDVVRSTGDAGTRLATEHVIGLGHHAVTYVHSPAMPSATLRRHGYVGAMASAGLPPDVVTTAGVDYTEEAGATAARRLLDRGTGLPTAIVTGNDQQAVGTLLVLARAGVAVPQRVSLTGFDDSRFAALSAVQLTTVRQDPGQMGSAAVAAAVRRIDEPDARPRLVRVAPTLVRRSSTAPPRH